MMQKYQSYVKGIQLLPHPQVNLSTYRLKCNHCLQQQTAKVPAKIRPILVNNRDILQTVKKRLLKVSESKKLKLNRKLL